MGVTGVFFSVDGRVRELGGGVLVTLLLQQQAGVFDRDQRGVSGRVRTPG
jgi:hypothetical protein